MTSAATLRIGEVAQTCGVSVETVRFYEKQGLLPRAARGPSGYRHYSEDATRRIRFIQAAKNVGFSLQEIRELLLLRVARGRTCAQVQSRALAKIAELDAKRFELERMRAALVHLAASCSGAGPTAACPLLDALDAQGDRHAER